jgi:hypothetical protein
MLYSKDIQNYDYLKHFQLLTLMQMNEWHSYRDCVDFN